MARDFFRERRQVLELILRTAERATEDGLKRLLDQTAEGQDRSTEQLREDLYARFASLDKREKQRKARPKRKSNGSDKVASADILLLCFAEDGTLPAGLPTVQAETEPRDPEDAVSARHLRTGTSPPRRY